ncbi:MAG: HisA/HisF-related TIM barrel protein [Thermoplasmatota archaeon]
MEIIPSISFRNNKPVVVGDGKYEEYSKDGEQVDVWSVLNELSEFEKIYFLDIDGIESNRLQVNVIRNLSARKEVWVDIGASDIATITDGFIAGANKIVVSTKSIYSLDILEKASDISNELIFSIDYKNKIISPSKNIGQLDINQVLEIALKFNIDHIVILDLSDEYFDRKLIEYLPEGDYKLYIGGNIKNKKYEDYSDTVDGIIIGLREAIKWQKRI